MMAATRLRSVLAIALCATFFGAAGCNQQSTNATVFFPASNEVASWTKTGDTRTFEAADLWKYIDGEAERYLKAGVQRVSTADYSCQNRIDAVVDIYVMGNTEGAGKILESEPMGDAKSVPLGDAARLYSQSLIFRRGPYLVRIVAYQESAEAQRAMLELGRGVDARLTKR